MATAIVKYAGKKYGKSAALKGFTSDDLYFETVVTENRSGKTKSKKVKKRLPEGLTLEEEDILRKAKKSAWRLDMGLINFLGIRFGWSAIVGLVPGLGDVLDFYMAFRLYQFCCSVPNGLSERQKSVMWFNMMVDAGIGLVPFLGDIADGIYKCNTRNVSILEAHLEKIGKARIAAQQEAADHNTRLNDQANLNHGGPPPQYTRPNKPEAARTAPQSGGFRGWFGGRKERDVESGYNDNAQQSASNGTSRPKY